MFVVDRLISFVKFTHTPRSLAIRTLYYLSSLGILIFSLGSADAASEWDITRL